MLLVAKRLRDCRICDVVSCEEVNDVGGNKENTSIADHYTETQDMRESKLGSKGQQA